MKNNEMKACIRKISVSFVDKYIPEETRYFSIIWDRYQKADAFQGPSSQKAVLTFSQKNLGLFTPFVLITVGSVIRELGSKFKEPTLDQVRNAVRACAIELGAPENAIKSMEDGLSKLVYDSIATLSLPENNICQSQSLEKKKVVVNSVMDIKFDGRAITSEAHQPLILFCELIRKEKLHWSSAFLLFNSWCRGAVKDPKKQFKIIVSKLNTVMRNYNLEIRVEFEKKHREKTGWVKLQVPEDIVISGDILKSQKLISQAEANIKNDRHKDALSNALEAFKKDPARFDAVVLFSKGIMLAPSSCDEHRDDIMKIRSSLYYSKNLRIDAVRTIENFEQSGSQDVSLTEVSYRYNYELNKIESALLILNRMIKDGVVNLTPDELEFKVILDILEEMKESGCISDSRFERLCATDAVKEVLQVGERSCGAKKSVLITHLFEYVNELYKRAYEYKDLKHLKGAWIKSITMSFQEFNKNEGHLRYDDFSKNH